MNARSKFQLGMSDRNVRLKDQIEIGDIVASSSCFPIGFAPLVFPDDYIKDHNNSSYQQLKSYEVFKDGVGLMDGGIADNQGIGSMVLADKRKGGRLDLILINDVGGNQMPAWEPSHESESVAGISLTDAVSKVLLSVQLHNHRNLFPQEGHPLLRTSLH